MKVSYSMLKKTCFCAGLALLLSAPSLWAQNADSSSTEAAGDSLSSIATQAVSDKLNINTATTEQLAKIPGLSSVASAITSYRDTNGLFSSIADLTKIDGIDTSLLEKISPFLSL